jgi:hypothetical protein
MSVSPLARQQGSCGIGLNPRSSRALRNNFCYSRGDCRSPYNAFLRRRTFSGILCPGAIRTNISSLISVLINALVMSNYFNSRSNRAAIAISDRNDRTASVAVYRSFMESSCWSPRTTSRALYLASSLALFAL